MKQSHLINKSCFWVAFCILVAFFFSPANASTIIDPVSVTSPQGDFSGDFALVNIINQIGLSATYTSGVTDFDTYVATVTHDGTGTGSGPTGGATTSGFTSSGNAPPAQFSFDLGASLQIDALAFWNTDNPGSVTSFELYADTDQIFGNGVGALLGTFNPTAGGIQPSAGQVFTFNSVNTRYVHIEALILATEGLKNAGIGEVAFRSSAVPIPAAVWLFGSGLLGLTGMARRKQAA